MSDEKKRRRRRKPSPPPPRRRRAGGSKIGALEAFGPAGVELLGVKGLISVQDLPNKDSAKDDKVPMVLAGAALYAYSQPKFRKYTAMIAVGAALAYKRNKAIAGELSSDPESKDMILSEATLSPEGK